MKKEFVGTFRKIWQLQIKIYHQTFIVPTNGAFYSNNKGSDFTLGLALFY